MNGKQIHMIYNNFKISNAWLRGKKNKVENVQVIVLVSTFYYLLLQHTKTLGCSTPEFISILIFSSKFETQNVWLLPQVDELASPAVASKAKRRRRAPTVPPAKMLNLRTVVTE
jgi:hypothetical protein